MSNLGFNLQNAANVPLFGGLFQQLISVSQPQNFLGMVSRPNISGINAGGANPLQALYSGFPINPSQGIQLISHMNPIAGGTNSALPSQQLANPMSTLMSGFNMGNAVQSLQSLPQTNLGANFNPYAANNLFGGMLPIPQMPQPEVQIPDVPIESTTDLPATEEIQDTGGALCLYPTESYYAGEFSDSFSVCQDCALDTCMNAVGEVYQNVGYDQLDVDSVLQYSTETLECLFGTISDFDPSLLVPRTGGADDMLSCVSPLLAEHAPDGVMVDMVSFKM